MDRHGKHLMVDDVCIDCKTSRLVRKDRTGTRCKKCRLILQHKIRKLDPQEKRRRKLESRRKLKLEAIEHYGHHNAQNVPMPCCECCGEIHIEFLEIDHINNDGARHRRENKISGGESMYRWLKTNGYPDGFQVLCSNCNQSKYRYGYCPHRLANGES